MTIQDKNTATGELSYFETTLPVSYTHLDVYKRQLLSLQKVDSPKGNVKAQVKHTARTLLECYNCHSLAEYNTLLNLYNVTVYEVRGSVDGKEYHGIMYGACLLYTSRCV